MRNASRSHKKSQILRLNKPKPPFPPRSITTWVPFESDVNQLNGNAQNNNINGNMKLTIPKV